MLMAVSGCSGLLGHAAGSACQSGPLQVALAIDLTQGNLLVKLRPCQAANFHQVLLIQPMRLWRPGQAESLGDGGDMHPVQCTAKVCCEGSNQVSEFHQKTFLGVMIPNSVVPSHKSLVEQTLILEIATCCL